MSYYEEENPVKGIKNGLGVSLLLWLLLIWALSLCVGCSTIHYEKDRLDVLSFGTDIHADSASWKKVNPDGSVETISFKGADKNASESTHTAANLFGGIMGAVIGGTASGGVGAIPGAAIGAASGLSLTEIWQTLKDWCVKK